MYRILKKNQQKKTKPEELAQLTFLWILCKKEKEKEKKKPSPAGQRGSIQDFVPVDCLSLGGNWKAVCILITFVGDIQSAHPELRSGSDERK